MVISSFGYESDLLERLHVSELSRRYKAKCGVDISNEFGQLQFADLYQCRGTGYKFWHPYELAGNENLYQKLSGSWPNYYGTWRWEYADASELVKAEDVCLEVGCGRGYFIREIESKCSSVVGLEFNSKAIKEKVCQSEVYLEDISVHARKVGLKYDKVFTFHVLEHITDPHSFLKNCLQTLKPGGYLAISVPNDDWIIHQKMEDAFNLPPHHMGCYNPDIFKKLASLLNVELVSVSTQPAPFPSVEVTYKTGRSWIWRLFNRLSKALGGRILRSLGEPGHTMFIVFKK